MQTERRLRRRPILRPQLHRALWLPFTPIRATLCRLGIVGGQAGVTALVEIGAAARGEQQDREHYPHHNSPRILSSSFWQGGMNPRRAAPGTGGRVRRGVPVATSPLSPPLPSDLSNGSACCVSAVRTSTN